MNPLERDIRSAILRALWAAKGPMPEAALIQHLRNLFPGVAFSDSQLIGYIKAAQELGLVDGIDDELSGIMWDLTARGKIKAQKL